MAIYIHEYCHRHPIKPKRWLFNDDTFNGNFNTHSNNIFNFDFILPFDFGCHIFDFDIIVHGSLDASILGVIDDNDIFVC